MIDQIMIAILGLPAIWLTQQNREDWKKYGCIFGILAQPFWFHTTYVNEQWGIFALSFIYAAVWLIGFYNYWIKPRAHSIN